MDQHLAARAALEPCGIGVAWRRRVEHEPAADSRARAEHQPVTARGDDRCVETKLSEPACPGNPREHRRRPVMHEHARGNRSELVELHVEPVARVVRIARDEHVAAAQLSSFDTGQRDGHALTGLGNVDGLVVHLHAAHAHVAARRLGAQHVAGGNTPGPERSGGDGADAAQREHPVDIETGRRVVAFSFDGNTRQRCAQLVEAGARLRADGDDLRARRKLARFGERQLERLAVDAVGLRHRNDTALDAEQTQDREVLVRLRAVRPRPRR